MAQIQRENFRPVSDLLKTERREFPLADATLADPTNAVGIIDGEWVTQDASGSIVRPALIGTVGNPAALKLCWPVWAELGRTDVQARAERSLPLLWLGHWEFETRVFDAAAVVASGAAISAIHQGLKVATITIGSRNFCGLVGHGGAADTAKVVAYVTKLGSANGGWLRIRGGGSF